MISVTILKSRASGAQERVALATLQISHARPDGLHEVVAMSSAGDGILPGVAGCTIAAGDGSQRVWRLLGRACEALAHADWVEL